MSQKDYLKDITEIKDLMNRSSRFISLSGLSGVMAGIYALIGAGIAHGYIYSPSGKNFIGRNSSYIFSEDAAYTNYSLISRLIVLALLILIAAVTTAYFLSAQKAKKHNEKLWDATTKRLLISFLTPLITGGLFCIILLQYGLIGLVAPTTLIFYGLSCFNASKYTLGDVKYLGLTNIILGLISTQFLGYGLYFWAIGFGIMHIVYGCSMYFKYDR